MSAPITFESSRQKKIDRQQLREARQIALDAAKEDYDRRERKKAAAKSRGENTWMLDSVNERITAEQKDYERATSQKAKKAKKKKKKKDSKHKDETRKKKQSSSDSDADNEAVWVESSTQNSVAKPDPSLTSNVSASAVTETKLQRDDWMGLSLESLHCVTRDELRARKQNKEPANPIVDQPGTHARELNPYWKEGGTGLPEEKGCRDMPTAGMAGDGGLSWWRHAYEHCEQQAKEAARSMEEVAAERYGSLDELKNKLREAEKRSEKPTRHRGHERSNRHHERRPEFDHIRSDRRHEKVYSKSSSSRDAGRSTKSLFRKPCSDDDDTSRHRSRSREHDGHIAHNSRKTERTFMKPRSTSKDRETNKSKNEIHFKKPVSDDGSVSGDEKERKRSGREDRGHRGHAEVKDDRSSRQPAWKKFVKEKAPPAVISDSADPVSDDGGSGDEQARKRSGREDRGHKGHVEDKGDRSSRQPAWKKFVKEKTPPAVKSDLESSSSSESSDHNNDAKQEVEVKEKEASPPPVQRVLTDKEMNVLSAKVLRAELMGSETAAELKLQLDAAHKVRDSAGCVPQAGVATKHASEVDSQSNEVLLTRTDRSGMTRPVLTPREMSTDGRRKKRKVATHSSSGDRERYFADDDRHSLKSLVEQERTSTAADHNAMFAKLAGRKLEKTDDDHQLDDALVDKAGQKMMTSHMESRDKQLAMIEHRKLAATLEKCQYCFENVTKHLIIAIGIKVYLCLPHYKSLSPGHCLIVPMQHVTQATILDEDVWDEIQVFRKGLTRMFEAEGEDCVFMETCRNLQRQPHMVLECVPMAKEIGDMAPIYFKKALQECETEWSQNKKVVNLAGKGLKNAIPKGFPYFAVDFGLQDGYAHIIEDTTEFTAYFGREVVGGMLGLDPSYWRKSRNEGFDEQCKKVIAFAERWKDYDWTRKLKENG